MAANGRRKGANETANQKMPRLRIRMYRHGLGDCLLLRFATSNPLVPFCVLIDCGLIMVASDAKKTMQEVARDIAATCNNRIDVVVMTHEHWDHASGFSGQQAQSVFEKIEIGEVWYAWTEDPQNALGKRLRKERAEKVAALSAAHSALSKLSNNPMAADRVARLNAMLGFFGLGAGPSKPGAKSGAPAISKTRDAFEYLKRRPGVTTRYLYPEKHPFTFKEIPNLRIFTLGPPQDESAIKRSSPTKAGREVYELAGEGVLAANLGAAFSRLQGDATDGTDCPFDATLRKGQTNQSTRTDPELTHLIEQIWNHPEEAWRKIDYDWTQAAETLALNLDAHTNNTCLVLAFEFTDTGEVFLFPADAQVGNWLSWQSRRWKVRTEGGATEVTGPDLLARTVFYKVGHHGSHNATLRELGLEQMRSIDLVAFVPVFREQALKNRWTGMPFPPLIDRLKKKTMGRLLRSDEPVPDTAAMSELPVAERSKFRSRISATEMYFEYLVD